MACIENVRDVTEYRSKFQSKSLKCIVVGREINSNCLQFYHTPTKKILSSNTYKLGPTLTSFPVVDLSYDGCLSFNTYKNNVYIHSLLGLYVGTKVWYKKCIENPDSNYIQAKIISIPMDHTSDLYIVKFLATSVIHQLPLHRLHHSYLTVSLTNYPYQQYNTVPEWIKEVANATILLPGMPNPKPGTLVHDKEFN